MYILLLLCPWSSSLPRQFTNMCGRPRRCLLKLCKLFFRKFDYYFRSLTMWPTPTHLVLHPFCMAYDWHNSDLKKGWWIVYATSGAARSWLGFQKMWYSSQELIICDSISVSLVSVIIHHAMRTLIKSCTLVFDLTDARYAHSYENGSEFQSRPVWWPGLRCWLVHEFCPVSVNLGWFLNLNVKSQTLQCWVQSYRGSRALCSHPSSPGRSGAPPLHI